MSTHTILMSTHNICFYGELTKIILSLSSNTLLICSSDDPKILTLVLSYSIDTGFPQALENMENGWKQMHVWKNHGI